MERQLGRMVHLLDDLLDVARISGGKLDLRKETTELGSVATHMKAGACLNTSSRRRVGEPAEGRVAVFFSDITARRRAEDELRRLVADPLRVTPRRT